MKSSGGSNKGDLYEDLFQSLERKFKSSASGKSVHFIPMNKDETMEEAEKRYSEETGRSINEQDIVFLANFVGTTPKGIPKDHLAE